VVVQHLAGKTKRKGKGNEKGSEERRETTNSGEVM
jgi:hypothetical protein